MDFKKLIFVSGKGGTGKTTLSLILARHLALKGKKTLFVELASRSSAQSLLMETSAPQYNPSPTSFGFDWSIMEGRDCLIEYISSFTGVEKFTQKLFDTHVLKTLVNVAPGLNDLSILGKLTSSMREHGPAFEYDHVVVDAHSTGSFHSLIKAPGILAKSVSSGPLKLQSEGIDQVLKDPQLVQYFFVGLFESLPMDELEDTMGTFGEEYQEAISILMNKKIPLEKSESSNDIWKNFLEKQIQAEKVQKARAKDLWNQVYYENIIVRPLSEYLISQQGEWLRPL